MRYRIRRTAVVLCVFVVLGVALAGYIASEVAQARAEARYEDLLTNYRMYDLADLEAWFVDQQELYLFLGPPQTKVVLRTGRPDVLPFDWDSFPVNFTKKLVGVSKDGVIVYPVTILEEPDTHKITFYNADEKKILSINPPNDYDPRWMAVQVYPNLYDGSYTTERIAEILQEYAPSRIQISVALVPTEDLDQLLLNEEAIQEASQLDPPIMLMGYGAGSNEVEILEIKTVSTNVQLLIGYPTNYYNTTWQVYSFDVDGGITGGTNMPPPDTNAPPGGSDGPLGAVFEGIDSFWDIAETNLLFTGSTRTIWVDVGQMGRSNPATVFNRFYGLGAAGVDSDSDQLSDAMERYAYNSDPSGADTDGDGLDDGEEVFIYGTDVLDSDTDGDGLPDGWEVQYGLDPTDDGSVDEDNGADGDPDEDGVENLIEYLQGRNPTAGVVADTAGDVNLNVHTPFE